MRSKVGIIFIKMMRDFIDKRLLDIEKKQIEEYALKKLNEK